MIAKTLAVSNRLGLHARPAALLARAAGKFKCRVRIAKSDIEVNGKSVMGLLMLAAECGSRLAVSCDGADEKKALAEIEKLFVTKFKED